MHVCSTAISDGLVKVIRSAELVDKDPAKLSHIMATFGFQPPPIAYLGDFSYLYNLGILD